MGEQYLAAAIPVFLLLIAIEAGLSRHFKRDYYRFNDAVSSLGCGALTLVFELFSKLGLLALYSWVYFRFGWSALSDAGVWAWLVFFMIYDFLYYWAHRWNHEINGLWNIHLPHHQSEEFNLTTALRQGMFQDTLNFPIYLPLALLGCPPLMFFTLRILNKLYQFWIHTRFIGRLRWVEGWLNTPSAHRVHHAMNDCYIDRNYGGTFMLWDRLFGTWVSERETEPAVFGVRKPLQTWNPWSAQFQWWKRLFHDMRRTREPAARWQIWIKPTGWRPKDVEIQWPEQRIDPYTYKKYDTHYSQRHGWFAAMVLTLATLLLLVLLSRYQTIGWLWSVICGVVIVGLLSLAGQILEQTSD